MLCIKSRQMDSPDDIVIERWESDHTLLDLSNILSFGILHEETAIDEVAGTNVGWNGSAVGCYCFCLILIIGDIRCWFQKESVVVAHLFDPANFFVGVAPSEDKTGLVASISDFTNHLISEVESHGIYSQDETFNSLDVAVWSIRSLNVHRFRDEKVTLLDC